MVGNGGVQTTWNDVHDEQSHEIWHMRIYIYIYALYQYIYKSEGARCSQSSISYKYETFQGI